jgi:hypothetical protein
VNWEVDNEEFCCVDCGVLSEVGDMGCSTGGSARPQKAIKQTTARRDFLTAYFTALVCDLPVYIFSS